MNIAVQIAVILTPIVIGIGFYFAYVQWSSTRKTRMAHLVMSLLERWDSPQMINARHSVSSSTNFKTDFENADKNNDMKIFAEYVLVANFFDTLGVLVCESYLDCTIAFDMLGGAEREYYRIYEDIINTPKERENLPYFIKLHTLFEKEARIKKEARLSSVKRPHAS